MKRKALLLALVLMGASMMTGCGLFNNPPPAAPTNVPGVPNQIQTAVAATLTAVAPTSVGGGTVVPPPTQASATASATANVTATPAPGQPTPTPGGENNPPTVQLLAPANGAQITVNQTIAVVALAADDSGLSRVEFYADNALASTQDAPNQPTTFQATFPWSSSQTGQHALFVIAYDLAGSPSAPAPVSVTVNANTTPPQVAILAPSSPQNMNLGAQINVQVVASDEAGVTQLQMLVDNQPYSQTSSPNPEGQTPFAATFIFAANAVGAHTILMRAVDTAGNLGTSSPLTVNVSDNTPPSISVNYSRYNVRVNEQVIVYTNATDASGIQRVELWADNALYNVYNSPNPPAQTSLAIQQIWGSNAAGNHVLYVRVVDVNNQSSSSPATNIFVRQPDQPTPTFTPFVPTRTPYPTRTPRPVIPPPNCQLQEPSTNFRVEMPRAVRIRWVCSAQGGVAQMQVFYQYSGVMATLATQINGDGGQEQGGAFDWTPQSPGVVTIFVVALDRLGQRGESPHIPGVIEPERPPTIPPPPTFPPERPTLAGRWRGIVDNGFFILELQPRIGCSETSCAWGGSFQDNRNNEIVQGEISGQLSGSQVTFSVQGAQPGNVTWNFQGEVTGGGSQIVGQWSESRAGLPSLQQGSVTFEKE